MGVARRDCRKIFSPVQAVGSAGTRRRVSVSRGVATRRRWEAITNDVLQVVFANLFLVIILGQRQLHPLGGIEINWFPVKDKTPSLLNVLGGIAHLLHCFIFVVVVKRALDLDDPMNIEHRHRTILHIIGARNDHQVNLELLLGARLFNSAVVPMNLVGQLTWEPPPDAPRNLVWSSESQRHVQKNVQLSQ